MNFARECEYVCNGITKVRVLTRLAAPLQDARALGKYSTLVCECSLDSHSRVRTCIKSVPYLILFYDDLSPNIVSYITNHPNIEYRIQHESKREHNVITLQNIQYIICKLQCVLHIHYAKLQMLLHKTTNCTTNNYTKLQKKLWRIRSIHKINKSHTEVTH